MLCWQNRPRLILAASALLLAAQISPWWYPTPDGCSYLSIGRSLVHGTGPANLGRAHLWYPLGYPAIISPLFLVADRPFLWLSVQQWVLMVALMLGVYVWARRVVPQAAVWIAVLSVINAGFWYHYRRTLSEVAFMSVLIWTVNWMRAATTAGSARSVVLRTMPALVLMALLCLIRPVGITLAAGFGAATLLAARRGSVPWMRAAVLTLAVAAAASVSVASQMAREHLTSVSSGEKTYLDNFGAAAATFPSSYLQGLQICLSDIGRVAIPGMFKSYGEPGKWLDINMAIYLPFGALMFLGWWRWARREPDPWAWTLPFYVALLVAYSMNSGARLFVPMIPLLMVCLWFALERLGERRLGILGIVLVVHLGAAGGYWLGVDLPQARTVERQWPAVDAVAAQIQADPGPVVVRDLPAETRLMLQLALDRSLSTEIGNPAALRQARWLVMPDSQPKADGFVMPGFAGEYRLFARSSVRQAKIPAGEVDLLLYCEREHSRR